MHGKLVLRNVPCHCSARTTRITGSLAAEQLLRQSIGIADKQQDDSHLIRLLGPEPIEGAVLMAGLGLGLMAVGCRACKSWRFVTLSSKNVT